MTRYLNLKYDFCFCQISNVQLLFRNWSKNILIIILTCFWTRKKSSKRTIFSSKPGLRICLIRTMNLPRTLRFFADSIASFCWICRGSKPDRVPGRRKRLGRFFFRARKSLAGWEAFRCVAQHTHCHGVGRLANWVWKTQPDNVLPGSQRQIYIRSNQVAPNLLLDLRTPQESKANRVTHSRCCVTKQS